MSIKDHSTLCALPNTASLSLKLAKENVSEVFGNIPSNYTQSIRISDIDKDWLEDLRLRYGKHFLDSTDNVQVQTFKKHLNEDQNFLFTVFAQLKKEKGLNFFLAEILNNYMFADVFETKNDKIMTLLDLALKDKRLECVKTLLAQKANPFLVDRLIEEKLDPETKYWLELAKKLAPLIGLKKYEELEKETKDLFCRLKIAVDWDNLKDSVRFQLIKAYDIVHRYNLYQNHERKPFLLCDAYGSYKLREIHYSILGQPVSTFKVEKMICIGRAERSRDIKKPLVLLFAGPSGHGKTELAEKLANVLLGNNLSKDYQMMKCESLASYYELFGGGGCYSGADLGSNLNNFLVVVLDEFEKLDEDARNGFLTVFDKGIFTNKKRSGGSQSSEIDVSRVIFILTTNLLDSHIESFYKANSANCRNLNDVAMLQRLQQVLRVSLRLKLNAFMENRIRYIIPFFPFDDESKTVLLYRKVLEIFKFFLEPPKPQLGIEEGKQFGNIKVSLDDETAFLDFLLKESFGEGARAIIRGVEDSVYEPLFNAWSSMNIKNGDEWTIELTDEKIIRIVKVGGKSIEYGR